MTNLSSKLVSNLLKKDTKIIKVKSLFDYIAVIKIKGKIYIKPKDVVINPHICEKIEVTDYYKKQSWFC